jgi:uncharacterized protein involved in outer membrane biogenesis
MTDTQKPSSTHKHLWVKWTLLTVAVLIVASVIIVFLSLDNIVRDVIQDQASASLNVPTTLNSVALSVLGGSLGLSDLEVGSPPNFSAPHTLTLGGCDVAVHYGELRGTPIHVSHITLNNPVLYIEQSNLKLNFQALMDQTPQTPTTTTGQAAQPMKLIIDRLDLNNCQVNFLPGLPGLSTSISATIPSLTLTNVGNADGNQNGVAIKEVVMQVITALAAKGEDVVQLPPALKALLTANLSSIGAQLGGDFNQQLHGMSGALGGVVGQGGNAVNNIGGSINGLLGGEKKNGQ